MLSVWVSDGTRRTFPNYPGCGDCGQPRYASFDDKPEAPCINCNKRKPKIVSMPARAREDESGGLVVTRFHDQVGYYPAGVWTMWEDTDPWEILNQL